MGIWFQRAALVAVLALCGCGGGGGGGGGDDDDGGGPTPPVLDVVPGIYLLPYFDAAGNIKLLEPRLPLSGTNPKVVDTLTAANIFDHKSTYLLRADFNGTHLSHWQPDRLVYVKASQLFSVSLNTAGPNTPVQVSSIANACNIVRRYDDYQDAGNALLFVWVKDGTGACTNPATHVVIKAGASAATPGAATSVDPYQVQVLRGTNGAIAGFLSFEASDVVRRDASFGNPTVVLDAYDTGSAGYHGLSRIDGNLTDTVYFVSRAAADPEPTLYRYAVGTGALTPVVAYPDMGGVPLFNIGTVDADNYYFGSSGYSGAMYRVAHASTTPVRMSSAAFTDELRYPKLTGSRVVVEAVYNGSRSTIFSLPKTATDAAPTPIVSPASGFTTVSNAHATGMLYITNSVFSGTIQYTSWLAQDDGTVLDTSPGTLWYGGVYDAEWDGYTSPVSRNIRVEFANAQPFKVYNTSTGALVNTVPGIANNDQSIQFQGFGKYMGIDARISRGIPKDYDAFFFDVDAGTQAQPVLAQAGQDEIFLIRD